MTVKMGCSICGARWEIGTPRTCNCNQHNVGYNFKGEAVKNSIAVTEVLRLSCDGITANPDIPVDDAARLVLAALDDRIKVMVQEAVEAEPEQGPSLQKLRRVMCGVGVVGQIDGHDVIRRDSVIELIDRAIRARGQE